MRPKFLLTGLFLITACNTVTPGQQMAAVKNRAAFDLNCSVEKIELTYLQTRTYGASGCRKQQTYVVEGTMVYKEGMEPVRNYYRDYDYSPRLGLGLGYYRTR